MPATTYHEASSHLACDLCGVMIDNSERGRAAHDRFHQKPAEVIDLTVITRREDVSDVA